MNKTFDELHPEYRERHVALLRSIRRRLPRFRELTKGMNFWYEDRVYRFYHHSFKVYGLQDFTLGANVLFKEIAKENDVMLDVWFSDIVRQGTGIEWEKSHNERWFDKPRRIVEAFFHTKYFVDMAVRYGKMKEPPRPLPSGWAALLELFNRR